VVAEDGTHTIVADSVWSDEPTAALRLTIDVPPRASER
jgi:hypothetical protein